MAPTNVPLLAQLAQVWVAYVIEADNAFEQRGADKVGDRFRISLPLWANALRLIDEDGITVGDLQSGTGAACNLGGLERWGWIMVGRPGTRREGFGTNGKIRADTVLRPTDAGRYARELWPDAVAFVEERWTARFGEPVIAALRDAVDIVSGPLPWSPPEVGSGDGFRSHVIERRADDAEPPLIARLGMALVQLTIDHEAHSLASLGLGANILRPIGAGAPAVREIPAMSGVSKEAVAMAVTFMVNEGLAVKEDRSIRLTPLGADALADYRSRAAAPTNPRLAAALAGIRDQSGALAHGLEPPEGCWRGAKPYVAQMRRVLADPTGALPWHPLVLHRGNWPDGS